MKLTSYQAVPQILSPHTLGASSTELPSRTPTGLRLVFRFLVLTIPVFWLFFINFFSFDVVQWTNKLATGQV